MDGNSRNLGDLPPSKLALENDCDAPKVLRSAKALKMARMARILPLLRVMKSMKACRFLSRLEELVHGMWAAFTALVSIMKALLTVLWLGHLQGCLWFLLASHPAFKVSP